MENGFGTFVQQLPLPLLLIGTGLLWLAENYSNSLPLPANRVRHGLRNAVVAVVNLTALILISGIIVFASELSRSWQIGVLHWLGPSGLLLFLVAFLMYDAVNYGIHRSLHTWPWLWRWHRSHHTDSYLDVTSAFRFHPGESVYRAAVFGVAVFVLGIGLEVVWTYQAFVVVALLVSHANIPISDNIYKKLRYFVVLPSIHRVHHSILRREHDSNYGIGLMFWDHILGTYTSPLAVKDLKIGLPGYDKDSDQTVAAILTDPIRSP